MRKQVERKWCIIILYGIKTNIKHNRKQWKSCSPLCQTRHHFKLDFQELDQHAGGKRLIHSTKRRKDNRLQSLKIPWKSEGGVFNPIFKGNDQGWKYPGRCSFVEPALFDLQKALTCCSKWQEWPWYPCDIHTMIICILIASCCFKNTD